MKSKTVRTGSTRAITRSAYKPAICGLAILVLSAVSCSKPPAESEPVVPVQAASVARGEIRHLVEADAILFPLQQSAIVPKISAPVKEFYVNRGTRVRRGQLLATLENKDLAAAAQDNKGTYDQAEAAYKTTTAADLPQTIQKAQLDAQAAKKLLDAQQKVYDSRQELFKQGAMPRKELDQSGVDLVSARNQYEIAQKHLEALMAVGKQETLKSAAGQLESAKGKYAGAQAQLSYSEIRSPIDGTITDRPLYPGEMAAAGTPLLTVMDLSQVTARSHIAQQDAALLKVGDKATITAPEQTPVDGRITVVSPALDPNSTTVEVWVQAKNPKQALRPGSSVKVSMIAQTVADALVIPAASLLTAPDGTTTVMQIGDDGRAHQKTVHTGIRQGDKIQIVDGLQDGERIVTAGAYGLPNNTKVQIQEQTPNAETPASDQKTGSSNDKK
jgi:HlyD family secretion protein